MKLTETDAFHSFFYAGDLVLLKFLIFLMIVDVLSGLGKAFIIGNLWSRKSLFGFSRKIFVFFIIILANIIDQILGLKGGLLGLTMFFYIANEGFSILENCVQAGLPFPEQLKDKLDVMQNVKSESKENIKEGFKNEPKK